MRSLSTTFFIFTLGTLTAHAELPENWSTNYEAALAVAATNQQPILVYFTASWCGPCKLMTHITLTDPLITQTLSNIEHVAIDIDEHSVLASKEGIRAVPTFLVLSATGDEVDRATGFQPVGDFLQWLTNGVSEAKAAAIRETFSKQTLADVDQLLVSTATNSTRQAALKLFDLCAVRDDNIVQAAAARLKMLAERNPGALLDGLDDPRLSVRIQTANVLRLVIDSFDMDPWADAAARTKAVGLWRLKFANASGSENPH